MSADALETLEERRCWMFERGYSIQINPSRRYSLVQEDQVNRGKDFVGGFVLYRPLEYTLSNYTIHHTVYDTEEDKIMKGKCCRIMLVTSWRGGKWNKPGGKIEEDENRIVALHREFKEETGYPLNLFGEDDYMFSSETVYTHNTHTAHIYCKVVEDYEEFIDIYAKSAPNLFVRDNIETLGIVAPFICREKGDGIFPKYTQSCFEPDQKYAALEEILWGLYLHGVISRKELDHLFSYHRPQPQSRGRPNRK
eukprot:TRINITY_DN5841_c0_g1_i1.p1 TRINITY_DN5841_c0_g1~~TRINITY_DN5841_c0_g1_i1.p1  ORF type:complete len:262 (-),score=35.15 TRINITY_DN5841_c0_g1_i1:111-866(-)